MFGIGSRTYYAIWHDMIFNFEYIRDRNYFVDKAKDAKIISAYDAYKSHKMLNRICITASDSLGANEERKERIKSWYENNKRRITETN